MLHDTISPYKTTCAVYDSSGTHFLSYFQESSRIDCLLLLKSSGLDLWKSFLHDSASRLHIMFGGKQLMVRIELTITVLQTVPLTSWVHEQAPTIAASVHDSLCGLAMAEWII